MRIWPGEFNQHLALVTTMVKRLTSLILLIALSFNSQAFFETDFSLDDDFSDSSLKRGIRATEEKCRLIPEKAVWGQVNVDLGECIKFWGYGLSNNTGKVIVFLHGDYFPGSPEYPKLTSEWFNRSAVNWSTRLNAPFIYLGRPGVYGSSGNHSRRRLLEEGQVISAALDSLKIKFGITEFVLAGQSGGGHLTTSLLTLRADIVCAVPTSAPSSPRIRYLKLGRTIDTTNLHSYEPTQNFDNLVHSDLRVIILGDPNDKNVFWESQTVLSEVLARRGIPHILLEGVGSGLQRHGLNNSARDVAGMCFHNKTLDEIKAIEAKLIG